MIQRRARSLPTSTISLPTSSTTRATCVLTISRSCSSGPVPMAARMADRWAQAKAMFGGNVYVVLKLFNGYTSCASQPDSWHQYGPASAYHEHLPHSVNVAPGFWHIKEASARLGRDTARFEADIKRMAATNAQWHLVTSWNEWGEGTGIEPTTQFGEVYIDILCRNLPGPTPCSGLPPLPTTSTPTPVATPTPIPLPTPTPIPTVSPPPSATPIPTPTPAPSSTPTSTIQGQPRPPVAAAFFYPIFPGAWQQGGMSPFSKYTPTYGFYSSTDNAIIDQQLRLADRAHLEAFISSWQGQGHQTDSAFKHILARSGRTDSPAPGLRWSVYYEDEADDDPSISEILSDLKYLSTNYFNKPTYLRVLNKPVVFVNGEDESCDVVNRWTAARQQLGASIILVLKTFNGSSNCAQKPESWHNYEPTVSYQQYLNHAVGVSPGYWHPWELSPRLSRSPARFDTDVKRMAGQATLWHLVTSWNRWGEGSGIEPTTNFGETYIQLLCRYLPGNTPCGGLGGLPPRSEPSATSPSSVTPTPTPTPTPTKTPGPSVTPTPTPTPPTPTPAPGSSQVLVGAGDIAADCIAGSSTAGAEATARLLDGIPGIVFTAGDLAYEQGSLEQFTQCYGPTWGRHKARTRPAPGNHEYLTTGAAGYCGYFGAVAACPNAYYAYNLGTWRVYMLNSSSVNKNTELAWLQADLAANPRQCSVAVWHHPTMSAGPHNNDEGNMLNIWRAFHDAGGDLVVNGHDHSYMRFAPLNRDSTSPATGGMREIVVGVGGKNFTTQNRVPPGLEVAMDGNTNPAMGVLKLTLNASSYSWQFVPVAGKTFTDSGTQTCR